MIDTVREVLDEREAETDGGTATASGDADAAGPDVEAPGATSPASVIEDAVADDGLVEFDQLFEIMKNQRRRYVLRYLSAADGTVTLGELAEQIAAWETGKEIRQISSQERKRVYVGLYQCHLPKMDDLDAVSYNKPRGRIESGENTDLFVHYLPEQRDDTEEREFSTTHVALAVFGGLTVLALVLFAALTSVSLTEFLVAVLAGALVAIPVLYFAK